MVKLFSFAVLGICTLLNSSYVAAQAERGEGSSYVSVSAGYADPTNLNGRFGWGGDAGFMFSNGITGSVFYRNNIATEQQRDYRLDHFGLGADWSLAHSLPGALGGLRGGVRAGASTRDVSSLGNQPSTASTEFSFGPAIGYDIWNLARNFSVGAESSLFFTMGPNQYATLYVLANLKYWF
jgi:hypothetical protein